MPGRPTEPLREEHGALLEHVEHLRLAARELPRLSTEERAAVTGRVLGFLRGTLLPHARAEEAVLYPAWAALIGYADAAAPMVADHEAIGARVDRLAAASADDVDDLQEQLYELHALILTHFHKEEEIQLAAFDARPDAAARLLSAMGEATGHAHATHG